MSIGKKEVEHVALLARLALTEEEKELYTRELGGILAFMEKLDEIDTRTIQPTTHVLDLKNVFRDDTVAPSMEPGDVVAGAPAARDDQFQVPRIML